ncbi:hypothetical protein PO864_15210 [Providencia alcalifaciens]|uniref:Lipoprotein n=1 Tax=Providencia alcalifaciens 205/92 TaxID=1256988 RepID=A0AAV3LZF9_9GAMM|nr:hypothetical protein [Providencia alcalifaciens]EUD09015.1 hypothetical protein HMPREF1563_3337 [Providencia alcalifaciens 205/92]WGZ53582.1 hypothetical protein PO864_15210 [Providencia alcalifaciens]
MKKYLLALVAMIPMCASAQCWVVSNLSGYSAYESNKYKYIENGMSNGTFQVEINKDGGNVKLLSDTFGGGGLDYTPISPSSMVGLYINGNTSTIETWSITDKNKVLYSKVVNNHELVTGTTSLVGDVVGDCSKN